MEETQVTETQDTRTNEELDLLADQTDKARNTERPMSTPKEEKDQKAAKDEYEFTHNGKPIKATRDQIIKWAQMGYDRPQFMQKFNQEKAKWEEERGQWEQLKQKYSPYTQIDEWAAKNPTQWQQLQEMWKRGMQNPAALTQSPQTQPQNTQVSSEIQPYLTKIQSLEQQLSQILPAVQQFQDWKTQSTHQQEDQALDQEIKSIREQHPDLDWNTLDENGKSLEVRVLEHAQNNGIAKFQTAFRDLLHEELLNRAQAKAQQSVAKGIQTRTKLGILGESPMPQKGRELNRNKSIRETSYEELENEIREELRRTRAS